MMESFDIVEKESVSDKTIVVEKELGRSYSKSPFFESSRPPLTAKLPPDHFLESIATPDSVRGASSPINVPKRYASFAFSFQKKLEDGELLGEDSPFRHSQQYCQFIQTRAMAKANLQKFNERPVTPNPKVMQSTIEAMKDFFRLSYVHLDHSNQVFPLANCNKCLGFSIVPGTSLVILAISQDKIPKKDEPLRRNMVEHLDQLNRLSAIWYNEKRISRRWSFELAKIPTREQYLLPRTLSMRVPHHATNEWVAPRTRCVEIALSTALCKAQRTQAFAIDDVFFLTVGGVIWADETEALSLPHFDTKKRNLTYRSSAPIEVILSDSKIGYVDVWDPCQEHCQIYMNEMLAVASAGGGSTSYTEPRAEGDLSITRFGKTF